MNTDDKPKIDCGPQTERRRATEDTAGALGVVSGLIRDRVMAVEEWLADRRRPQPNQEALATYVLWRNHLDYRGEEPYHEWLRGAAVALAKGLLG